MALFSNILANPRDHKWHSIRRKSSANKKQVTGDTAHFKEKRVRAKTCIYVFKKHARENRAGL